MIETVDEDCLMCYLLSTSILVGSNNFMTAVIDYSLIYFIHCLCYRQKRPFTSCLNLVSVK